MLPAQRLHGGHDIGFKPCALVHPGKHLFDFSGSHPGGQMGGRNNNNSSSTSSWLLFKWVLTGVQHPLNMPNSPVIVLMGGPGEGLQWGPLSVSSVFTETPPPAPYHKIHSDSNGESSRLTILGKRHHSVFGIIGPKLLRTALGVRAGLPLEGLLSHEGPYYLWQKGIQEAHPPQGNCPVWTPAHFQVRTMFIPSFALLLERTEQVQQKKECGTGGKGSWEELMLRSITAPVSIAMGHFLRAQACRLCCEGRAGFLGHVLVLGLLAFHRLAVSS